VLAWRLAPLRAKKQKYLLTRFTLFFVIDLVAAASASTANNKV
jgi:hypothetical protein